MPHEEVDTHSDLGVELLQIKPGLRTPRPSAPPAPAIGPRLASGVSTQTRCSLSSQFETRPLAAPPTGCRCSRDGDGRDGKPCPPGSSPADGGAGRCKLPQARRESGSGCPAAREGEGGGGPGEATAASTPTGSAGGEGLHGRRRRGAGMLRASGGAKGPAAAGSCSSSSPSVSPLSRPVPVPQESGRGCSADRMRSTEAGLLPMGLCRAAAGSGSVVWRWGGQSWREVGASGSNRGRGGLYGRLGWLGWMDGGMPGPQSPPPWVGATVAPGDDAPCARSCPPRPSPSPLG